MNLRLRRVMTEFILDRVVCIGTFDNAELTLFDTYQHVMEQGHRLVWTLAVLRPFQRR